MHLYLRIYIYLFITSAYASEINDGKLYVKNIITLTHSRSHFAMCAYITCNLKNLAICGYISIAKLGPSHRKLSEKSAQKQQLFYPRVNITTSYLGCLWSWSNTKYNDENPTIENKNDTVKNWHNRGIIS